MRKLPGKSSQPGGGGGARFSFIIILHRHLITSRIQQTRAILLGYFVRFFFCQHTLGTLQAIHG